MCTSFHQAALQNHRVLGSPTAFASNSWLPVWRQCHLLYSKALLCLFGLKKKTHVKSLSQCLVYPMSSIILSSCFHSSSHFYLQWLIGLVPPGPCKLCSHLFPFFSPFPRDFITTHKICQADPHTTARTLCELTPEFITGAKNSVWHTAYWQRSWKEYPGLNDKLASTEMELGLQKSLYIS